MATAVKRHDRDMTSGSIIGNLLLFALPLLVGNLFQQLYNMVDTWVIGQTGNDGAYAAVGSIAPIINVMIGLFSGFATGAGVVISRAYGAKDVDGVRRAVHTAVAVTLLLTLLFTAVGVIFAPHAVALLLGGRENEVYPHAVPYLTIYFAGIAGLLLYNMGAGILRAVGDSRRPFYFLLVSSLCNIVLDVVFVFLFDMGVRGVALATVIAQLLSAALTVTVLLRTTSCVKVTLQSIRIDTPSLKKIIVFGVPSAIQLALTALSNIFVQSYVAGVNGDQTAALGGWTSYTKIDQLLFLPSQSLSLAATTFVGQNLGAGNVARARRGVRLALLSALAITLPLTLLVMLLAPHLAGIFNPSPDVVAVATLLLTYLTPFYLCTCFNQVLAAGLRGAGNSTAPMVVMLSALVGFRQIYLFVVSNYISNDLLPIAMGYPAGWVVCMLTMCVYYLAYRFHPAEPTRRASAANEGETT